MLSPEHKEKIARFSRFTGAERVSYCHFTFKQLNSGEWTKAFASEESDLMTGARSDHFEPLFFGNTTGIKCPWRDDAFMLLKTGSTQHNRIPSNTAWICFGPYRGTATTQNGEAMDCDPAMLAEFQKNTEIALKAGTLDKRTSHPERSDNPNSN